MPAIECRLVSLNVECPTLKHCLCVRACDDDHQLLYLTICQPRCMKGYPYTSHAINSTWFEVRGMRHEARAMARDALGGA